MCVVVRGVVGMARDVSRGGMIAMGDVVILIGHVGVVIGHVVILTGRGVPVTGRLMILSVASVVADSIIALGVLIGVVMLGWKAFLSVIAAGTVGCLCLRMLLHPALKILV